MLLPRGFSVLLCFLCVPFVSIPLEGQPSGNAQPAVHLEPHDGRSVFYLGEPIQLDLVFENHTGSAFTINASIYGDLSEKVEITPATGWFQWQTQSGHDYASIENLGDQPIRIPVRLDEGFVFREAGHYRVRVTTARVYRGSALGGPSLPAVTTNEVGLDLKTMPADVESSMLRGIRADLASEPRNCNCPCAQSEPADSAMARLAALQGDEALAEKEPCSASRITLFRRPWPGHDARVSG